MSIVLHHHPYTRAANVVWMLEEVGAPYQLRFVDFMKGAHKSPELLALNPMGKLPTLVDGDMVVTESAAIGLYLADRYAPGKLAPALNDPARGTYLRWALFAPSVIEPGTMAKTQGWDFKPSQAGWGTHEAMLSASQFVATIENRQGLKISCPEEIAWRAGWIGDNELLACAESFDKSGYGDYLRALLIDGGPP